MNATLLACDLPDPMERRGDKAYAPEQQPAPLDALSRLSSMAIETSLPRNLSRDLHRVFDPVSEGVLPIYFGPLLGRLYLEGL